MTQSGARIRSPRRLTAALALWLAAGCGAAAPRIATVRYADAAPRRALYEGPLTNYVAAAGVVWLVVLRPQAILEDAELRAALGQVIPAERFDEYADVTGFEPRQLSEALIAGTDSATLYLGLGPGAGRAMQHWCERRSSVRPAWLSRRPDSWELRAVVGQQLQTLSRWGEDRFALAVGDPRPAQVARLFAERRLADAPTVLEGVAFRELPARSTAPIRLYWAPPPTDVAAAASPTRLPLDALLVELERFAPGRVRLRFTIAGSWRSGDEEAITAEWEHLASSDLGRWLTLDRATPVQAPSLSVVRATLEVEVELRSFAEGLRRLLVGRLAELISLETTSGSGIGAGAAEPPPPSEPAIWAGESVGAAG